MSSFKISIRFGPGSDRLIICWVSICRISIDHYESCWVRLSFIKPLPALLYLIFYRKRSFYTLWLSDLRHSPAVTRDTTFVRKLFKLHNSHHSVFHHCFSRRFAHIFEKCRNCTGVWKRCSWKNFKTKFTSPVTAGE